MEVYMICIQIYLLLFSYGYLCVCRTYYTPPPSICFPIALVFKGVVVCHYKSIFDNKGQFLDSI